MFYACVSVRLDSALHDARHEQEVRAAVESVFPFSQLAQFLTLPPAEKELQLKELPYIVAGICLFNKSSGVTEAGACLAALQQHALDPDNTIQAVLKLMNFVRQKLMQYSGCQSSICFLLIRIIHTRV